MPDWSYHPAIKPALMSTLAGENARRVTMALMKFQAATPVGRALFRWFARTQRPTSFPADKQVALWGLHFPSPIGLAPGIDVEGNALALWPDLLFGFLQVGPMSVRARAYRYSTGSQRLSDYHGIVTHKESGCPGVGVLEQRLRQNLCKNVPIGVYLDEANPCEALVALEDCADFFSVHMACADDPYLLTQLRASTQKPLLLRLLLERDIPQLHYAVAQAVAYGFDGAVVAYGGEFKPIPGSLLHGPHLRDEALTLVSSLAQKYGDSFPLIGAGGILTPTDACAFLAAGAKLVELFEGLVYAGPGLPKRILQNLALPLTKETHLA